MKRFLNLQISSVIVFVLIFSAPGTARAATDSLRMFGGGSTPDGVGVGQQTYQVFLNENFTFPYSGGSVCISSQAGACAPIAIDDEAVISINGVSLYFPSFTHDMAAVDITSMLHMGDNQINIRLIDHVGPSMGGSQIWLAAGQVEQACVRVDIAPISGELTLPPVDSYWVTHQAVFQFELSGNRCPDVPIYPTIGSDPSFTIESAFGTTEVNNKGEIDLGPNLSNHRATIPFGAQINTMVPPTYTFYRLFEYEASADDFSLKSEQKIGDRVRIKPPTYALAYVISVAVSYRQQILQFGVEIRPYLQQTIQQLMMIAPLLKLPTPLAPNYVLAAYKPSAAQLQQLSGRPSMLPPSVDVVDDLNSFFGPEFVSAANISQLNVAGQSVKAPGQNIRYNSAGFIPNSRVYLALIRMGDAAPTIETETRASADGTISGVLRLPMDAKPGRWLTVAVDSQLLYNQLKAIGNGQDQNLTPYLAANTSVIPAYTPVIIDIKPNDVINSINLGDQGVIPVSVLTTSNFNAKLIAPLTVQFGPDAAPEFHQRGHVKDVNKDGFTDMMLHFATVQTGILSTDTKVCLFGQTTAGTYIFGCDTVRIVPPKR
jgi:hypothetical protein